MKARFEKGRKPTEAEKLKAKISKDLSRMVQQNKPRTDSMEKFKKLIEEYNKGLDADTFFAKLVDFAKDLSVEDKRGMAKQLTEEELAIFDILVMTAPEMTTKDCSAQSHE